MLDSRRWWREGVSARDSADYLCRRITCLARRDKAHLSALSDQAWYRTGLPRTAIGTSDIQGKEFGSGTLSRGCVCNQISRCPGLACGARRGYCRLMHYQVGRGSWLMSRLVRILTEFRTARISHSVVCIRFSWRLSTARQLSFCRRGLFRGWKAACLIKDLVEVCRRKRAGAILISD